MSYRDGKSRIEGAGVRQSDTDRDRNRNTESQSAKINIQQN